MSAYFTRLTSSLMLIMMKKKSNKDRSRLKARTVLSMKPSFFRNVNNRYQVNDIQLNRDLKTQQQNSYF